MRPLITTIIFFIAFTSFCQVKEVKNAKVTPVTTIESIAVSITIDSVEELESTLDINDIKNIIDDMSPDGNISFEIKCNGKPMSDVEESSVAYEISIKAGRKEALYNKINAVKKLVAEYYNNQ